MRGALVVVVLAAGLILAATTGAAGKPAVATMKGKCYETDKLDSNGALKSAAILCNATGPCACPGSPRLTYTVKAAESGTGAPGRETGTIVAVGPKGTLTFRFKGAHTAVGGGKGNWSIVKTVGYAGIHLRKTGTYVTVTTITKQLPQSLNTNVKLDTRLSCWEC